MGYFHQYANKDHWILRCTVSQLLESDMQIADPSDCRKSDLRTAMCITLKYKQLLLLLTTAETGLVMTKSIKQTVIHPLDVFYVSSSFLWPRFKFELTARFSTSPLIQTNGSMSSSPTSTSSSVRPSCAGGVSVSLGPCRVHTGAGYDRPLLRWRD